MDDEVRKSISVKIKPNIQRQARHAAIESGKRLGQWVEEAMQEKIAREEREETEPK